MTPLLHWNRLVDVDLVPIGNTGPGRHPRGFLLLIFETEALEVFDLALEERESQGTSVGAWPYNPTFVNGLPALVIMYPSRC